MTTKNIIKVTIPAHTVEIDAGKWALEYDLETGDVPADVKSYFNGFVQDQIDFLRMGK